MKHGFVSRNIIAIVMIPAIIGLHYGWNLLQNNENLVTADQKITGQPIVAVSYSYRAPLKLCFHLHAKLSSNHN